MSRTTALDTSPALGSDGTSDPRRDQLLLLALLAGFVVGVFALGYMTRALDADERVTLEIIGQPLTHMVRRADILYPPLYFIALKLWTVATDSSVFWVRLFSVIFALAALYLTYRCGAEMFSRREGMWATLLLAMSNFHMYYATEARMYSMVEAGGLLVTLAFFRSFIVNEGRVGRGFVAAVAFLSLTHYFAWFFILAQGLYFLLFLKRRRGTIAPWWAWATRVAPFGVLSLAFLMIVHRLYPQAWDNLRTLEGLGARSLGGALYLLGAFHGMLPFPDTMRYGFLPWSLPFLAFAGTWMRERRERAERGSTPCADALVTPTGYVLMVLVIPIVGLTLLSIVLFPLFLPRYLIFGLPMYYLLVSRCAVRAASSTRGQFLLLLPAMGWSVASALSSQLLRWFG
jgi:uncharacterized membrane protein